MVAVANTIDHLVLRPDSLAQQPSVQPGLGSRLAGWLGMGASTIGRRFKVIRPLGRGSSANVSLVADRRTGQMQALKLYLPGLPSQIALDSSRPCEGQISGGLKHPRILSAQEHGVTDTGQYYVLTEFSPAGTLAGFIGSSTWAGDRLALLWQAAEALAALHEAGYLHCDVCPANYLISEDGAEVKLFDFGASLPAGGTFDKTALRVSRDDYLPPELLRSKVLNQAIDMFQFGVTAYQILTGVLPWEPQSSGTSVARVMRRPDNIRGHLPLIDPELASAVHRMLSPDPSRRFASMRGFLKAIEGVSTIVPGGQANAAGDTVLISRAG